MGGGSQAISGWGGWALGATFCGALLAACGPEVAKNPAFVAHQRAVERLGEESKAVTRQIEDLTVSVSNLERQMNDPRSPIRGQDNRLKALEQRMLTLEGTIEESSRALHELRGQIDALGRSRVAGRSGEGEASGPVGASGRERAMLTRVTRSGEMPGEEAAGLTSEQQPTRGFYHAIREGETLEEIARQHNVPLEALRRANRIPEGRVVLAGQQIFVPGQP